MRYLPCLDLHPHRHLLLLSASALAMVSLLQTGCSQSSTSGPSARQESPVPIINPALAAPSPLYLQAPPFDRINDNDYLPAFMEGMRQHSEEVRAIADNSAPPSFSNTIVALERSGALLNRVGRAFSVASSTHTNEHIQKIDATISPQLAKHGDSITLNGKLFARVHALYEQRQTLGLDAESLRLLERSHLNFVRSGALLSETDKNILRSLNEEGAQLTNRFSEYLLKDTNASAVVVDTLAELDGLSASDIETAAAAAKSRGLENKWVIPIIFTTRQPTLTSLKNRALRERIFRASISRGCHGGDYDTRAIIARLAQLRAQKAQLLGFPSNADYVLGDQMAKTPQAALALLSQVAPAAVAKAREEMADLQAVIDREQGGFTLQPWDWAYYAEKVRKEKYDLDETQIRPYLELENVLKDGVFFAAHQLYGITFTQRTDLPVYDPDARVFEVFNADGSSIGLIYFDFFARESKKGGAWMDSFVDQSLLLGTKPVVCNEMNIAKPPPGKPALMNFDEVNGMFHEFGHGLHGLFSHVTYPSMSGANTPRDFGEFPSQFNERWELEPAVLAHYAKHYQTGEPMPPDLVEKIKKSSTFNRGFDTLEYVAAALVDMEWNALPASAPLQDPVVFEQAALAKYHVDLAAVPPRYHSWYFNHIWANGYEAGYYAYLWTAVLAADSFAWFQEHGGMTLANGTLYRDGILSRGGTVDAHQLYLHFRGQEPRIEPLLKERGLVPDTMR